MAPPKAPALEAEAWAPVRVRSTSRMLWLKLPPRLDGAGTDAEVFTACTAHVQSMVDTRDGDPNL